MAIKLDLEMWKELSETRAISGFEHRLHPTITKYLKPYVNEIKFDHLSSVVGVKDSENSEYSILLAAHIDEIGFLVKSITKEGYLRLQSVGSWWAHTLLSQSFCVDTKSNASFIGCIGSKIPHGMSKEEQSKVLSIDDLYLDLGVDNDSVVVDLGIEVGDPITPYTKFRVMSQDDYLYGKAWDDRSGIGILLESVRLLKSNHATIYVAGTAQEEVGQRGARTVAHMINPTIAIALDVCDAEDTLFHQGDIVLGRGPVLTVMDGSSIANPMLLEYVEKTCLKHDINYRYSCSKSGGTDNGNIHKSLGGIIGMTISIPVRYMHSVGAILHQMDIIETIKLISTICNEMTSEDIKEILQYNQ